MQSTAEPEAPSTVRPYDPRATYVLGDRIAHPTWGTVQVFKAGKYRLHVARNDQDLCVLHACSETPAQLLRGVHEVWTRPGSPREKGLSELTMRCNDLCDLLAVPGPGVTVELAQLADGLAVAFAGVGYESAAWIDTLFADLWKELARAELAPLQKAEPEIEAMTQDQAVGVALVFLKWNDAPNAYRVLAIWGKAHGRNPRFIATLEVHGWTRGGAAMLLQAHNSRRSPEMLAVLGEGWTDAWDR